MEKSNKGKALQPHESSYDAASGVVLPASVVNELIELPSGTVMCRFTGGAFYRDRTSGIWFSGFERDGKLASPRWVCSYIEIKAKTRDEQSANWGVLVEWLDDDGEMHRWAMPLEMLEGDGSDVRRELARQGLTIAPSSNARAQMLSYFKFWPVTKRARCVNRTGWHSDCYVLPDMVIGESDASVVFQNSHAIQPAFAVRGDVDGWKGGVAALARGNSRLLFAISTAFAGPLAYLAGEDSGGFHLRGNSSTGKSTVQWAATSVWGSPETYPISWRASLNGLEGVAFAHNDGFLVLDELSQIDPAQAGEAAYMLANGQGKTRARDNGAAVRPASWRLLVLSSGEVSLAAHVSQAGKRSNAGQEVRLADIEADAGAGMGCFEVIGSFANSEAFALEIKHRANCEFGAVGMAWLHILVEKRRSFSGLLTEQISHFISKVVPEGASGQVRRVARRFALVAAAGELATMNDLTGWDIGEAFKAVELCFRTWMEGFGTGNREDVQAMAQVKSFFQRHAARFGDAGGVRQVANCAGYVRVDAKKGSDVRGRRYFVFADTFRNEVCAGMDWKYAARLLKSIGWIKSEKAETTYINTRVTDRFFVFLPAMWEEKNDQQ